MLAITFLAEGEVFMFSTSVQLSLNDLLQPYTWVLESISTPNCDLSLFRISADFMLLLVRNLIRMHCAIAKGTISSLILITTNKKPTDIQQYVVTVTGILSLTTSRVILFYVGISALSNSGSYLNSSHVLQTEQ
jgi:hypothetical protein